MLRIKDVVSRKQTTLDPARLRQTLDAGFALEASSGDPVLEVAAKLDADPKTFVIVLDRAGEPEGMLDPAALRDFLNARQGRRFETLREALEQVGAGAEEWDEQLIGDWEQAAYDPFWCKRGKHFTNFDPCPVHGG